MKPSAEERARAAFDKCNDADDLDVRCICYACLAAALAQAFADGERAGAEREREECAREFDELAADAKAQLPVASAAAAADIFVRMAFVIRRRANESEGGR